MNPVTIVNTSQPNFNVNASGKVVLPFIRSDAYQYSSFNIDNIKFINDLSFYFPLTGAQSISLQVAGSWSGSIVLSASIDAITWTIISVTDIATSLPSVSISSNSLYAVNVGAFAYLKIDGTSATGNPEIYWTTGQMAIGSAASGGGGGGGGATEVTLQTLLNSTNNQKDNQLTVWTDNTGVYFIRQTIMNTQTGVQTFQFRDPATNAIVVPGAGLKPPATSSVASNGVTKINSSGTITTGGVAQVLMAANPARRGINIQNISNQDLWISQVGTASAGPGSIKLKPDGYYEPYTGVAVGAISIFGATTGQQFTAYEF